MKFTGIMIQKKITDNFLQLQIVGDFGDENSLSALNFQANKNVDAR